MSADVNRLLDELHSRQQIQEQLHRWTRGADRIDLEEMQSAFNPAANVNRSCWLPQVTELSSI